MRAEPIGTAVMQRPDERAEAPEPLLPDVGIVGLVSDVWGGPWMPRHHVLTRLGRYFNVVWVDHPREWRDWWLPGGGRDGRRPVDPSVPDRPGFTLYRPGRWTPEVYRPRRANLFFTRQRLLHARRLLRRRGAATTVLYLWRPDFDRALELVPHAVSCYHIDDEYTFSETERPLDEREASLIRRVDQVFIHSPALFEKNGHLNPRTRMVPNGVDYGAFARPAEEPADLRAIPRPRVGYVGVIKKWLDLELMARLAARHPEWSFVFVGPLRVGDEPAARALAALPNVYFLGAKPVGELPGYVQHVDVNVLCYARNDYTKFIYPMKLHEYLAAGRPVVGTPIRSLVGFSEVVELATTEDEWSRALAGALSPEASGDAAAARRREVARAHDWDVHVGCIARSICECLGPDYAVRLERAASC